PGTRAREQGAGRQGQGRAGRRRRDGHRQVARPAPACAPPVARSSPGTRHLRSHPPFAGVIPLEMKVLPRGGTHPPKPVVWRSSRYSDGLTGPCGLDVSLGTSHAAENREPHSEIHLTSSVAIDYAANLRCTLTSSTYPIRSWRVRRAFCVRAVKLRVNSGRTPVGSIAQRLGHRFRHTSYLIRPDQGTPRGSRPPCPADRVV